MTQATLALEDGTVFRGQALGAIGETRGELVFSTGMTGYQEVLTDPSYRGQIVVMAAPHIGNTGLNDEDDEARSPYLAGFVVRQASALASSWRAQTTLDAYLKAHDIVAITGCPTRALVRHIRSRGAMRCVLSSAESDAEILVQRALAASEMSGADLVSGVTCDSPYGWDQPADSCWYLDQRGSMPGPSLHVVAFDFGIKHNILRLLVSGGFRVTVVPATTTVNEVMELRPDGVFLSNGPGDPAAVTYAIDTLKGLLGRVPIFGICLGHQLLGLALGGRTYKLKFGHRGINQPVKNLLTGQVEITTHNHGFAVEADSLPADVEITHVNLNDGCVEGLRHVGLGAFSVQFHPEAGPGPHDAIHLFDQFRRLIANGQDGHDVCGLETSPGGRRHA